MAVRNYDLAFSLGFSCGCTQALREAGLQFASFPFDWVGSPGLLASVRMLAGRFRNWLEKADLELYDVRRAPLFSRVYRNSHTRYGFPHDFPSDLEFDAAYEVCRQRYDRRIERLIGCLTPGRRVLAIYIERMIDTRLPDPDLRNARRLLSEAFLGVRFDLLYVFQQDGCCQPQESDLGEGVRTVALDYKICEAGEVVHEIDRSRITAYLRQSIAVPDTRTAETRQRHRATGRHNRNRRWGQVWFGRRLFNEFAYKLYRRLERQLSRVGVIPREGPLWF